ncbi:MAG TPA: DAK2 domain-containing protein [Candidatus Avilachnospira avistercoris]|nr:DAK2 domain-containing protein [Candidatus Avilachnospira avistercoris]
MESVNADVLRKCFIAGAKNLEANKEYINELNVFPVPDGDTGTNMTMTIMSAAKAVAEVEKPEMAAVCKAISGGSLRGARGNSGVILSQLLRGFCKVAAEYDELSSEAVSEAFQKASETAYKAVMKPKEGTILTVARGMAEKTAELASSQPDVAELLRLVIEHGDEVLSSTPELLPVLKEAGVVDSGGQGLMTFLKGVLAALQGKEVDLRLDTSAPSANYTLTTERRQLSTDDIKFGYCTEFLVQGDHEFEAAEVASLSAFLESIGDSIVCVADDEIIKVHVHTNHPGLAFEEGLKHGSLSRMKVDNMREEHEEKLIKDASKIAAMESLKKADEKLDNKPKKQEHKESAFVAVCAGSGLSEIFEGLGASFVIEGGQTMNPSTEDILNAVELVNADNVFILPNNKNIILAAEQAARINKDVNIFVVPTKTIPQGITAIINYCDGIDAEENLKAMTDSLQTVSSGQVTYAVRHTQVDGKEINEGDIMGIGDRGILAVGQILNETALELVRSMSGEQSELVTVYYGEDVKKEDAELLCEDIRRELPSLEVELQYGGQPVYYYIISVE